MANPSVTTQDSATDLKTTLPKGGKPSTKGTSTRDMKEAKKSVSTLADASVTLTTTKTETDTKSGPLTTTKTTS